MFSGLAMIYGFLNQPKPWANILLSCNPDVRESNDKTASGELPSYAVYFSELNYNVVRAGQPPQQAEPYGTMLQLSTQPFLRCHLNNDRPETLYDVSLTFRADFQKRSEVAETYSIIHADKINGNGSPFDFALINFGEFPMRIHGLAITTSTFSTSLSNLKIGGGDRALLSVGEGPFPPQYPRKKTGLIFPNSPSCSELLTESRQGNATLYFSEPEGSSYNSANGRVSKVEKSLPCRPH